MIAVGGYRQRFAGIFHQSARIDVVNRSDAILRGMTSSFGPIAQISTPSIDFRFNSPFGGSKSAKMVVLLQ